MLITRTVDARDLVILGSDGLFDNLFDNEIISAVTADVLLMCLQ